MSIMDSELFWLIFTLVFIWLLFFWYHFKRVRLAAHNIIGHPLMEIAYIFGLRKIGNFIHNKIFKL